DTFDYIYSIHDQKFRGFVARPKKITDHIPAVIVAHDWSGRNQFACEQAQLLAKMGYIGFALDMYGNGVIGANNAEKNNLMQPLLNNRSLLRTYIQAAFNAVASLSGVNRAKIAVIGYCFGGLCALDLARSGVDLLATVSFHGLLNRPLGLPETPILSKVLVLHGYDDPSVKPDAVHAFCQEMTRTQVDWQMHMYGHTKHAFTNPVACDHSLGLVYSPIAAKRAWKAMVSFLQESFEEYEVGVNDV
ncbi:MAG: hypothetical protein A3F46_09890, partial [Legionellales bacterium RIFCSPHIGHO2_12_FULL_42_9]